MEYRNVESSHKRWTNEMGQVTGSNFSFISILHYLSVLCFLRVISTLPSIVLPSGRMYFLVVINLSSLTFSVVCMLEKAG